MTRLVGLVLVLLAVRAHALTFGVGCADPCGQEVIVQGGEATCELVVGNDGAFNVTVTDAAATVQHADGAEVVPVPGVPQTLAPGATTVFPFVVSADPADVPGDILSMDVLAHLSALGIAFSSHFGDQLQVVATSTCDVTTTTFPVPTTTTTSTSTTSTLPVLLPPRLRVCGHNDNPKKCQ